MSAGDFNADGKIADVLKSSVIFGNGYCQTGIQTAEAEYQSLRVTLESNLMNQKAGAATVNADYTQAKLQADTDKAFYDLGVIVGLAYKNSKSKADELTTRNNIENERLDINGTAIESQLAQQGG